MKPSIGSGREWAPDLVVVGAASRDLVTDDPLGWRLGGGATYSALLAARMGVSVGVVLGVDREAAGATELRDLEAAGAHLATVHLSSGPVFRNVETPDGRRQDSHSASDRIPPTALPASWATAPAFLLAPVADELADDWADVPRPDATVGLGWQGLLREALPGKPVRQRQARPRPLFGRADMAGVSPDDLRAGPAEIRTLLPRAGQRLIVTLGDRGGLLLRREATGVSIRRVPAVASAAGGDPVGAGDVFLATWLVASLGLGVLGGRPLPGDRALLLAAVAASLTVERPGLEGVPTLDRITERVAELAARPGE